MSLSLGHIEKLCVALNCTPDDLFEWHPSAGQGNLEKHPLQKLRRKESNINISGKLRELSPQKLEEVKEFLKGL